MNIISEFLLFHRTRRFYLECKDARIKQQEQIIESLQQEIIGLTMQRKLANSKFLQLQSQSEAMANKIYTLNYEKKKLIDHIYHKDKYINKLRSSHQKKLNSLSSANSLK